MAVIKIRKVDVDDEKLYIYTRFRKFVVDKSDILAFRVIRVPSLFDELGIELQCGKRFLITERDSGFLELSKFLRVEDLFGPLWYSDAESGRELTSGWE